MSRSASHFQNTTLPARAKPIIASRLPTSSTAQSQGQAGCTVTVSSTSSLPMKPDSGGRPIVAMAARKNSPASRSSWPNGGAAHQPVAGAAAAAGDEVGEQEQRGTGERAVRHVVERRGRRRLGEDAHGQEQRADGADQGVGRERGERVRLASTPIMPTARVTAAAGRTNGSAIQAAAPAPPPKIST